MEAPSDLWLANPLNNSQSSSYSISLKNVVVLIPHSFDFCKWHWTWVLNSVTSVFSHLSSLTPGFYIRIFVFSFFILFTLQISFHSHLYLMIHHLFNKYTECVHVPGMLQMRSVFSCKYLGAGWGNRAAGNKAELQSLHSSDRRQIFCLYVPPAPMPQTELITFLLDLLFLLLMAPPSSHYPKRVILEMSLLPCHQLPNQLPSSVDNHCSGCTLSPSFSFPPSLL